MGERRQPSVAPPGGDRQGRRADRDPDRGTDRDAAREAYEGALDAEEARAGARLVGIAIAAVLWLGTLGWWLAFRGGPGAPYASVIGAAAAGVTITLLPRAWRPLALGAVLAVAGAWAWWGSTGL